LVTLNTDIFVVSGLIVAAFTNIAMAAWQHDYIPTLNVADRASKAIHLQNIEINLIYFDWRWLSTLAHLSMSHFCPDLHFDIVKNSFEAIPCTFLISRNQYLP
jgi:hypothetical protein